MWQILLIILTGIIIFFHSLTNSFVLDDPSQITGNSVIHSLNNIPKLFLGSSFGGGQGLQGVYYKPLMTTTFALLYHFWQDNPLPYHLLQITIHILNSILVYLLFKRFFNQNLALFLGLVFLAHPLNIESALYTSALQDSLFFLFGSIALLLLLKPGLSYFNLAFFSLLIFLSLLSKESGILFLLVTLSYRLILSKSSRLKLTIFTIFILVLYAVLRWWAVGPTISVDAPFPIMRASLLQRLLTIPKITYYYLKNFFLPSDLAVGQMWVVKIASFKNFYLPLFADLVLVGTIWAGKSLLSKKELKVYLLFVIWLLIGLGLHLHLLPLDATVTDRWFYFPMIGLLGMVGVILQQFSRNLLKIKYQKLQIILLVPILILITLATKTFLRTLDWHDGLTLASHDVRINSDSFALENNLGYELIKVNEYDQALSHEQRSVELAPYWWLNWNNLGVVYRHQGNFTKAKESFKKATENTSTFYLPYENLTELLVNYGDPKEAERFIVTSSKRIDLNARLYFLLGLAEYKLNNRSAALEAARESSTLDSQNQQAEELYQGLLSNKTIVIQKPNY